jgi:hypothetical protein
MMAGRSVTANVLGVPLIIIGTIKFCYNVIGDLPCGVVIQFGALSCPWAVSFIKPLTTPRECYVVPAMRFGAHNVSNQLKLII